MTLTSVASAAAAAVVDEVECLGLRVGLGRIVALYYRSSTLYQIH